MAENQKILIIAGESSGDHHAAGLVKSLQKLKPEVTFHGIGGDQMAATGVQLMYHINQMAFLGVAEIVRHLPFIRKVFQSLKKWMREEKPIVVILVDYPGFNLRLAKMVKKLGIPVIYYICPQLWAWGVKRVETIRKYVDLPLVIFKFEEEFYAKYGIFSKFVGHPLADEIKITVDESSFRKKHGLDANKPIVALLPGSRQNEIRKILPVMVETAELFDNRFEVEWAIAKAGGLASDLYDALLKNKKEIKLVEDDTHNLVNYAHTAVVASGTATLEAGYLRTPMVVLYKVSPLTYAIGKRLVMIKNIALANIVCGEKVVPELIQNQLRAKNVVRELRKYFEDSLYYQNVSQQLQKIGNILGPPGAADRAAREIVSFLNEK